MTVKPLTPNERTFSSMAASASIIEWFATHDVSNSSACVAFEQWAYPRFGIGPAHWREELTVALKANCTGEACHATLDKLHHLVGRTGGLQGWCEANHAQLREARRLFGFFAAARAVGTAATVVGEAADFAGAAFGCGSFCDTVSSVAGFVSTGADCVTGNMFGCATGVASLGAEHVLGIETPSYGSIAGGVVGGIIDAGGGGSGGGSSGGGSSGGGGSGGSYSGTYCSNTCRYASDGDCDDGGPGAEYSLCSRGSDCRDCGSRAPPPPPPASSSGSSSTSLCSNSCSYASDGDCDDGGAGAEYSLCNPGTDCQDCGTGSAPSSGGSGGSSGPLFSVSAGSSHCAVISDGTCVTDGGNNYGNSERCTITADAALTLSVSTLWAHTAPALATASLCTRSDCRVCARLCVLQVSTFNTESCCDRITVGGTSYSGSSGPSGVSMSAGQTMSWYTDGSVTSSGFTICGTSAGGGASGGGGGGSSSAGTIVTSDGTVARPMCAWESGCSWDYSTRSHCAAGLCQASGFSGGSFVSGNNMCNTNDAPGQTVWVWDTTNSQYRRASFQYESAITARCTGNAAPPPPLSSGCDCATPETGCLSAGYDVSGRCGCADWGTESRTICYTVGSTCSAATRSNWVTGAYWRTCTSSGTSPPSPSPPGRSPPPLQTGTYCESTGAASNPCATDGSDYCCDYDCTWCGPMDFCQRFSPFRAHSGVCSSSYVGTICANHYEVCTSSAAAVSCDNSCVHAYDNECDDGGAGAEYAICQRGSDCNDCSLPTATVSSVCSDTCLHASNGVCDDGGPDSEFAVCPYHTDCTDCGPRAAVLSAPPPPPIPTGQCRMADYGDGAETPFVLRLLQAKNVAQDGALLTPPFTTLMECNDLPAHVVEQMMGMNCSMLACDGANYGPAGSLSANMTAAIIQGYCPQKCGGCDIRCIDKPWFVAAYHILTGSPFTCDGDWPASSNFGYCGLT
jgi:hypothetical protein